eukprot:SAG31_NODE_4330_length_3346_cov_2.558054_3_plen_120_part_00
MKIFVILFFLVGSAVAMTENPVQATRAGSMLAASDRQPSADLADAQPAAGPPAKSSVRPSVADAEAALDAFGAAANLAPEAKLALTAWGRMTATSVVAYFCEAPTNWWVFSSFFFTVPR